MMIVYNSLRINHEDKVMNNVLISYYNGFEHYLDSNIFGYIIWVRGRKCQI